MNRVFLGAWLVFLPFFLASQTLPVSIIPRPEKLETKLGNFEISGHTLVLAHASDTAAWEMAKTLVSQVYGLTGLRLIQRNDDGTTPSDDFIRFLSSDNNAFDEGYNLEISPAAVVLNGHSAAGLFYAWQSFEQLLPPEVMAAPIRRVSGTVRFQALSIEDHPRFGWRGMHLDVSRHFFDKTAIKKYLDFLAMLKFNIFHWHLTDSQGWRLEIEKYPRLTQVGAFRVQRPGERFAEALPQKAGEVVNYGGYYTRADVREIVAYAKARHITVLPEIDMPGHSMAALVAYPQFSSQSGPVLMPSGQPGAYTDSFNPGNDSTYIFLESVLTEVMSLFPGEYIHIGGDEVDRGIWKDNLLCQEKMRKENLNSLDELQAYFIRRIEAFINSKGKKMVGWDEIIAGGLAPRATVMSWRGNKGGLQAAHSAHTVVMAPALYTYFDLYQGDPKIEPEAYSHNFLSNTYQFDPVPYEMNPESKRFILGGHGCLWTETVPDWAHAEHMLLPRLYALAEAAWSVPGRKNFDDFKLRLDFQVQRLAMAKVNYARSAWNVALRPVRDTASGHITVACSNELGLGNIFYTVDGSMPSIQATPYKTPFTLTGPTQVRAAAFNGSRQLSDVSAEEFAPSRTTSKALSLASPPNLRFAGYNPFTLNDGIRGSSNPFDGRWNGFTGAGLNAVIDLGTQVAIRNIGFDLMEEPGLAIYLPTGVDVEISEDGRSFIRLVHYSQADLRNLKTGNLVKVYREFSPITMRYIRLIAQNPPPQSALESRNYILIDEIAAN